VQEANAALQAQQQEAVAAVEQAEQTKEGAEEGEEGAVKEAPATTPTATEAPQLLELPVQQECIDRLYGAIKTIIARTMQGSSDPLSHLCISVSARLGRAKQVLESAPSEGESKLVQQYRTFLGQGLENLLEEGDAMETEIKGMAAREAYGPKTKGASPFEDVEGVSVRRWEVISSAHFSKAGQVSLQTAGTAWKEGRKMMLCFVYLVFVCLHVCMSICLSVFVHTLIHQYTNTPIYQ